MPLLGNSQSCLASLTLLALCNLERRLDDVVEVLSDIVVERGIALVQAVSAAVHLPRSQWNLPYHHHSQPPKVFPGFFSKSHKGSLVQPPPK